MAVDPGPRRRKSLRRAETKARYQDVVRASQLQIAQDYADDPVIGRIPGPKPNPNVDRFAAAPLGLLLFGDPDIKRGYRDTRDFARAALDTLTSPETSKREKLEAAGGVGAVGGALNFLPGRKPKPKPEPAPRPAGAEKIVATLPEAKKLRRKQEAGYRTERKKRAAAADDAMRVGGEEGYRAALAELKGELPKLKMGDNLKDFDQATADELFTHIQNTDAFRPFEKIRTQTALRKVLDGQVPTKSEIRLLGQAFGPELAEQVTASVTKWRQAKNLGLSVINIPRSLQASIDLSAPFRQGLVLGAKNPRLFAREFGPMLKAFKSEGAYEDTMGVIAEMEHYPRMQKGKLALTDLEGSAASREDYFNSPIAETLTGGKRSPVRMSGRAYTAFLNKFRADAFNHYLRMAEDAGHDIDDELLLKSLATFINTATGRGSIKAFEPAMNTLTTVFFSPRLIASRLQFFNPGRYVKAGPIGENQHPFVLAQNRKAARNLLGGIGLTLALAEWAGADVVRDPRNSDFGKIKVGDTRIDITGGHQGYVVNAWRQYKGETVSSTTGEVKKLEGGFGKRSRAAVEWDFAKNKLAPAARYVVGWQEDQNFDREPFDPVKEAYRSLVPIGVGGTVDAYKEGGPGLAALTGGLGGIGFGVLTYGAEEKGGSGEPRRKSLRSRGGGRSKSLRRR